MKSHLQLISTRRDQTEDCMVWGPCKSRGFRMKQSLLVRPCLALDTGEEEAPATYGYRSEPDVDMTLAPCDPSAHG